MNIILIILLLLIYVLFLILNQFFSFTITLLIIFGLIYYFLKLTCYGLVFPGSFKLYSRIGQNCYGVFHAKKVQIFLEQLESIIDNGETIQQQNPMLNWLKSQSNIFSTLKFKSKEQQKYIKLINHLISLLEQEHLDKDNIKVNIKLLYNNINLHLIEFGKYKKLKRWLFLNLFGTLDEVRQTILTINPNTTRIQLQKKKQIIDCLHINNFGNTTVLFCNPNGGYYEYMYFDCNWFKFYQEKNVNVILWNYRSYGKSTGTPNLKGLLEDAQYIVDYFKAHQQKYNIQRFGIHGYSLGGAIASSIAYQKNLDFLIIDRSFSSLGQVASKMFNSQFRLLFNILTNWDEPNYMNYWNYKGPKIILQDSMDEILPYEAQLATAIAKEQFTPFTNINLFDNMFDKESKKYQKFFNSNILNDQKMNELKYSLNKISQLLLKVHQLQELQDNQEERNEALIQINDYIEFQSPEDFGRVYILEEIMFLLRYKDTSLCHLLMHNNNNIIEKIQCFFVCAFTYGQQGQDNFLKLFESFQKQLITFINQPQSQLENLKIDIKKILDLTSIIVDRFQEYLDEPQITSSHQVIEMNVINQIQNNTRIGTLITVRCGHNGSINIEDLENVNQIIMFGL